MTTSKFKIYNMTTWHQHEKKDGALEVLMTLISE